LGEGDSSGGTGKGKIIQRTSQRSKERKREGRALSGPGAEKRRKIVSKNGRSKTKRVEKTRGARTERGCGQKSEAKWPGKEVKKKRLDPAKKEIKALLYHLYKGVKRYGRKIESSLGNKKDKPRRKKGWFVVRGKRKDELLRSGARGLIRGGKENKEVGGKKPGKGKRNGLEAKQTGKGTGAILSTKGGASERMKRRE